MSDSVLKLTGVTRSFQQASNGLLEVLTGVDLDIDEGEVVALVGPSGAGKSTLLHIVGLLERPDGGSIAVSGRDCGSLGDGERTMLRRHHIGFVYQYHHLLPEFSALENVAIPQIIAGTDKKTAKAKAAELLTRLGLAERMTHRPAKLSGGEQQRVAIARALANDPRLLLADEPTGNLDPHTASEVFAMLLEISRSVGLAALVATHNPELAARMDRTVRLHDGHLIAA